MKSDNLPHLEDVEKRRVLMSENHSIATSIAARGRSRPPLGTEKGQSLRQWLCRLIHCVSESTVAYCAFRQLFALEPFSVGYRIFSFTVLGSLSSTLLKQKKYNNFTLLKAVTKSLSLWQYIELFQIFFLKRQLVWMLKTT